MSELFCRYSRRQGVRTTNKQQPLPDHAEKLKKIYERSKASKICSFLDIPRMNQEIFTQISPQAKSHVALKKSKIYTENIS